MDYKNAGVDIEAGYKSVCIIGIETALVPVKVTFHIIYQ